MIERIKTALIVLLTLSLAALMLFSFALASSSGGLLPADLIRTFLRREKSVQISGNDLWPAAFPCEIAVIGGETLYMPLGEDEYNSVYQSTKQLIEEAVGSLGQPTEISSEAYLKALTKPGILFVYDYPLPFYMLSAWSNGAEYAEDFNACALLAFTDGTSVSLMAKADSGSYYLFPTQADAEYLAFLCSSFAPNGLFAFSFDKAKCLPDTPLVTQSLRLPAYTVLEPSYTDTGEISKELSAIMMMNPYLASVYPDADSTVYVEGSSQLRIYNDGRMLFSASAADGGLPLTLPQGGGDAYMLSLTEQCRAIAQQLWDACSSQNTSISLASVSGGDGSYTLTFEAYIGGAFIDRGYSAVSMLVQNNAVAGIFLYPIQLSAAAQAGFIPFSQAAAVAPAGSYLRVHYVLGQIGMLIPVTRALGGEN